MLIYRNAYVEGGEITLPRHWDIGPHLGPRWLIDGRWALELEPYHVQDKRLYWRYRLFGPTSSRSDKVSRVDYSTPYNAPLTAEEFCRWATDLVGFLATHRDIDDLSLYGDDESCGYCGRGHHSAACTEEVED